MLPVTTRYGTKFIYKRRGIGRHVILIYGRTLTTENSGAQSMFLLNNGHPVIGIVKGRRKDRPDSIDRG